MAGEQLAPDIQRYLDKVSRVEKFPLPKREDIDPYLTSTAESVANISGEWNPVEIYTPPRKEINQERDKVFDAYLLESPYNPTFSYPKAESLELSEERQRLSALFTRTKSFFPENRANRLFKTALMYKVKDDIATCDLVDGIKSKDEAKIAKALRSKYPGLDQSLLDLAQGEYTKQTIEGEPKPVKGEGELSEIEIAWLRQREITPEEQESAFRWALDQYGILRSDTNPKGFNVLVTDDVTAVDVRDKYSGGPTVLSPIDRPEPLTADKLLALMAHEIEGHALQTVNGEELFLLGGGRLKIDNEQYYEGLGLRRETDLKKRLLGVMDAVPRPFYVFAVNMAEQGATFFEIFKDQVERWQRVELATPIGEELKHILDVEPKARNKIMRSAWNTTYRVMRGHTDMTNPHSFAMAKDLGYLRGFQTDEQLRTNGLGFVNEAGIIARGGLQYLAELELDESSLPYQFKDVSTKYWHEVLKPIMQQELSSFFGF